MRLIARCLAAGIAILGLVAGPAFGSATLGPRLREALAAAPADRSLAVWVEFVGKGAGTTSPPATPTPARLVSERSLQRRLKVLPRSALVDAADFPVAPEYVAEVASRVIRLRQRSRWLDAVSVEATPAQIAAVRSLPCVASIELVARSVHRRDQERPAPGPAGPGYGDAAAQLQMIHADALHDRGLTGLGVLVAHLDTGYYSLRHEVFRPMRIAAAYDFVDHDADVTNARSNPDDTLEHGQFTLSALAGFMPGKLVGVAPGATLLLARTESTAIEDASEEDTWIAALEWADSLGADIVSSSLKFLQYDVPGTGYTWQNMDGATARVTRAAQLATQRGMLIVNGAGNEGGNLFHNTLVAPADGAGVLAVGAVTLAGARADFSSVGPTTDFPARIKPDVMAPGVGIVVADVVNDSSYTHVGGTSLACPLTAGVAALLLSVHDATPAQICNALRLTASRALSPDNEWGWGLVDALAAYEYLVNLFPTDAGSQLQPRVQLHFANPFRPAGRIAFGNAAPASPTLRIYDAAGRRVREWKPGAAVHWDGDGDDGRLLPRGLYFVELRTAAGDLLAQRKLTLMR